jgi:hypothetical protein
MFQVGDIVAGRNARYCFTNSNVTIGEVTNVDDDTFRVKVLEHTEKSVVGAEFDVRHTDDLGEPYFRLVEEGLPMAQISDEDYLSLFT